MYPSVDGNAVTRGSQGPEAWTSLGTVGQHLLVQCGRRPYRARRLCVMRIDCILLQTRPLHRTPDSCSNHHLLDLANFNKPKSEPLVIFLQPALSTDFYISGKGNSILPEAQAKKYLRIIIDFSLSKPTFNFFRKSSCSYLQIFSGI